MANGERLVAAKPVKDDPKWFDEIERRIIAVFLRAIYRPLMKIAGGKQKDFVENSGSSLLAALRSGRITFHHGAFKGKLSAAISRDIRELGAEWDKKKGVFRIRLTKLPKEIRSAIDVSESRFRKKAQKIDEKLSKLLPDDIAKMIKVEDIFDKALWQTQGDIEDALDAITVIPKLTKRDAAAITKEYRDNMDLYIKKFTRKQIKTLREKVKESALLGNRHEALVDVIRSSYHVSKSKAEFLARQETKLFLGTFKESRYTDAGSEHYRWKCVVGSAKHPVRPSHKVLDNKVFRWDDPPVVTPPGQVTRRANPGKDFNCRCFAIPLFRYNGKIG